MTPLKICPTTEHSSVFPHYRFSFSNIDKLVVHLADCIKIIPTNTIEFIQASGGYSQIHLVDGSNLLICRTLKSISESLGDHFLRTHKSYMINLNYIQEYRSRDCQITMESMKTVQVSRTNKPLLKEIFQTK